MKTAKIIMAQALALASILASSCSGPKQALSAYLDATIKGNHIEAYRLVSSADKPFQDANGYLAQSSAERNNLIRALSDRVSYQIKSVGKQGDQAEVKVEISAPDYAAIINDLFEGDPGKINLASGAGINKMVEGKYGKKIPLTKMDWDYTLVKEQDGWKVFLGWESGSKIRDLVQKAKQMEKEGKLYQARDQYQEVLQLDPENSAASAGSQNLVQKIAQYEQEQAYAGNLMVSKIQVTGSAGGGQGVFMELKNNGDRELGLVEITIDFDGPLQCRWEEVICSDEESGFLRFRCRCAGAIRFDRFEMKPRSLLIGDTSPH